MGGGKNKKKRKSGGEKKKGKKTTRNFFFSLSLLFSLSVSGSPSTLTQILVRVVEVGVADRRYDAGLSVPVHADLLEPLEVRRVADALADELLCF